MKEVLLTMPQPPSGTLGFSRHSYTWWYSVIIKNSVQNGVCMELVKNFPKIVIQKHNKIIELDIPRFMAAYTNNLKLENLENKTIIQTCNNDKCVHPDHVEIQE